MTEPPEKRPGEEAPRPGETTEVVFRAWNDAEAALVAGLLRAAGIRCSSASDIPHSIYPLTVDGLGEVRVLVVHEDAARARELIAARQVTPSESPDGEE